MARATVARTLHDVGLAAWFGGTLMGAVGVNGAAADVDDPRQRARVANAGWDRWTPFNLVAIGAHLAGSVMLINENKSRIAGQKGVAGWSVAKTALTGAALLATGYSRVLGAKLKKAGDFPAEGGTTPSPETPPEVASAQKQLKVLQWAIPGLTGGILYNTSVMGEQQRATEQLKGVGQRLSDYATNPGATASAVSKAVKNLV